ncbi:SusC/RagA family TonB-linked outer membrane protein [Flavihumibacter stibioxidans]|uniref:TonB-dependent receptor n=1 Tax=Flavihumibacter stibioxidans TaxID=1834163 RepID=A0ABR7MBC2_9BACT|nr:SusC/RagA family TonB-linked outer membrane protein [Flavihumibacter stibioxidans]MBC6492025.1 TonB-dependent receptor [Flavihumibacter stibioxidans]
MRNELLLSPWFNWGKMRHGFLLMVFAIITVSVGFAQDLTVRGQVKDSGGNPLSGVAILNQRTKQGTNTDDNGRFSLAAKPNDLLTISYVGMTSQSVRVAENQPDLLISLANQTEELQDVVVTALGIKRKDKALGYSVQAVQGDGLQTVKGIDVATSLTGKVAGMLVRNSTEFSEEPTVLLRGETPLLVIDGVPYGNMTLRDIPADDIEHISVLKGATASALYGFRGASGALMVTTKKGSAYKGLSVTFNSSSMFSAGYLAIPELQSEFGRVVNTATNTYARSADGSWGVPMDGREVVQWDPVSKSMKAMPYLPIGKDNFRNFLEQGSILNNNINVTQQGELGSFRASATWVRNKGTYPNSEFSKITYGIGGEMKFNKFTLSSSLTYNKNSSPNIGFSGYTGYDPMYSMLIWSASDWDVRQYRDYWLVPNEVQNSSFTAGNNNPYFDRFERTHSVNKDIFSGSLMLNYDFTNWLKLTFRTGYDTYSNRQDIQVSKGSFQGAGSSTVILNGTQVWGESMRGSYNLGLGRGYSSNNEVILSANQKFGDFQVDGFVGGSIYYNQDEGIESRTSGGLSIPGFYSLKSSINPVNVSSSLYKRQSNSLFGRLGVSYRNFAFLEGTLRNDWVSTLPQSTRSYLYPSVSASFVASELLPKMDWLSMWKLRGSWATSKMPAGIYSINSTYGITTNAWGTLNSANYPTTIRGTDVRPESANTFEVGTVANLFKNRVTVDVTYYSKRMYDFLRSTGISPASGYTGNYININEEITRRGVEIFTNVTALKTKDWRLDVSANWSKYARYYTRLDDQFSADRPWVKVGERADHYILRDYLKDPQGNIIHNNGVPLYSGYDSRYGYSDPDWIWGFGTALKYKNWQLNISMDGRVGGLAQTTTEMYMWRAGSHPNSVVPERYLDANTPGSKNYVGQGVKVVSGEVSFDTYGNITKDTRQFAPNDVPVTYKTYTEAMHKGTAWGGSPSTVDTYVTTFLKIREVSLTYDLPKSITGKVSAKGASISAVGQNLFYHAKQFKYSDIDGGTENFSDPSLRYVGVNLKVVF